MNKYWSKLSEEERSAEMARRRAKSKKPAGGLSYASIKTRKEVAMKGVKARAYKNLQRGEG